MKWNPAAEALRLKGAVLGKPLIGPRSVNIHLTNVCDRRCCFCWYFSSRVSWRRHREDIAFKVLAEFIRDCVQIGVQEIKFEGGEIILYPHIVEAFRMVVRSGLFLSAYTHLAYESEHLDYLRLADRLSVNLSAATASSYAHIHGADKFEDVMSNLRILSALRKKYQKPLVVLTFIINELNYRDLTPFLDMAEDLGVERISFRLFEATVEMKDLVLSRRSAGILRRNIEKEIKMPRQVKNNLSEILGVMSMPGFLKEQRSMLPTSWNNDRLFYSEAFSKGAHRCYAGLFYAFVDERGRVIAPCDSVGVCVAGNIYKEAFRDIWFSSKKFEKIRSRSLKGIDTTDKQWVECRNCGHAEFNKTIESVLFQKSE